MDNYHQQKFESHEMSLAASYPGLGDDRSHYTWDLDLSLTKVSVLLREGVTELVFLAPYTSYLLEEVSSQSTNHSDSNSSNHLP